MPASNVIPSGSESNNNQSKSRIVVIILLLVAIVISFINIQIALVLILCPLVLSIRIKRYRIVSGLLGIFIAVFTIIPLLFTNKAARALTPFDKDLKDNGAKVLCSNGDSGFGPDNKSPWQTTYYSISVGKGNARIINEAKTQGYEISSDTQTEIRALKGVNSLTVVITRSGSVPLYCDHVPFGRKYGDPEPVTDNREIIKVSISVVPGLN